MLAAFFVGAHRYEEIRAKRGVATNLLADRLRLLAEHGRCSGAPVPPTRVITSMS